MSVNFKEKPANFVIFDFFRPQFSTSSLPPPPPSHEFEGPVIAMGEIGWRKLRPKKLKTISQKCWKKRQYCKFDCPAIALGEIGWKKSLLGEIGWKKSLPKKSNWSFRLFQPRFLSPYIPSSQSLDPRIRDFVSSSNIFDNFNFSKLLMGEGEGRIGWRKSWLKKSKTLVQFFFRSSRLLSPNHPHTRPPRTSQSSQDPRWVTKIAPKKSKT